MEQRRSSVKIVVGLFVFVGVLLLAASIFLLGQRGRYFSTQHSLRAFFTKVGGLHEGAAVRLAGVAVGRVTRIQLPRPPDEKVLVELNVAGGAIENVRRDSVARIETLGFLGDKFIEISVGGAQEPRLPDGGTLRVEEPPDVGALVGQGQRVLGHAEGVATSLDILAKEVKEGRGLAHALIYDPEGGKIVEKASRTIQELDSLLQAIRSGEGAIPALLFDPASRDLVKNLTEASDHLKEISEKIARGEGTLGGLLVDPTVYEDLTALLEGTQRSWILRSMIRSTLESGREARKEQAKVAVDEK